MLRDDELQFVVKTKLSSANRYFPILQLSIGCDKNAWTRMKHQTSESWGDVAVVVAVESEQRQRVRHARHSVNLR
jgi:hypothetical protein